MSCCRWFILAWEFRCWGPKVLVLVDRVMVIPLEEKVFGFVLGSVFSLELRFLISEVSLYEDILGIGY